MTAKKQPPMVQTGSTPVPMRIDITSDILCPYCYIGVRQLLSALEVYNSQHPSSSIRPSIRLQPFQLAPGLSAEPTSRQVVRERKFGKELAREKTKVIDAKLRAIGVEPASPTAPTSSSHAAHRLLTHALRTDPASQLPLALSIFDAYHSQGAHPSDIPLLAGLATKHGVFASEIEAEEWLRGNEEDVEVQRAYLTARRLGVSGVPFFVFQERWAASGAMGVEEFVRLFGEVLQREAASSTTPSPSSTNGTAVSPSSHRGKGAGETGSSDGEGAVKAEMEV